MKNLRTVCIENTYTYFSLLAKSANGNVINQPGEFSCMTNIPHPFLNPVFKLNSIASIKALQNNAESKRFSIWSDHAEVTNYLSSQNAQRFGSVPVMVLDVKADEFAGNHVEVKQISHENLEDWQRIIGLVFNFDQAVMDAYRKAIAALADDVQHFAAYIDGAVVGVGSMLINADIPGFYNLSVLPECRQRGVATAIHHARIRAARDLGFDYVTLQATPMATKLDMAIGFKEVSCFEIFMLE